MSYPKLKSENYANLGGMDIKASQYLTDQTEFLNLQNVDFRSLGALSSFAGSTKFSITSATSVITGVAGFYASFGLGTSPQIITTDLFQVYDSTGGTFLLLMGAMSQFLNYDQRSFVLAGTTASAGALFGAGNSEFFTYQGSTASAWQFSLGKPTRNNTTSGQANAGTAPNGLSGSLKAFFSLVRQDGFYGPSRAITFGSLVGTTALSFTRPNQPSTNIGNGLSYGSFGLSGIQMWVQLNNDTVYQYGSLLGLTTGAQSVTIGFGYTNSGSFAAATIDPKDFQGSFIYGIGSTQGGIDTGSLAQAGNAPNPQVIEYYANQLFSAIGSRVIFSNPGTPEIADYRNYFFVGQNDPNPISAMKAYFTQLLIWKFNRTFALSGTGPDSFSLTECSPIYGCIAKNSVCVWEQNCWFLDAKGICEFNGANTQIVSGKIQPLFERMNVNAAVTQAFMVHVKERNEVWCAIPIDGSSTNNIIVVYDYLAKAWTTRTCPAGNLSYLSALTLGAAKTVPYYGNYSGIIGSFGSSYIGDNGSAFTSIIKSRFLSDLGNSVTKVFRRLYLDAAVPTGQTQSIQVNLYADKNTTAYYSTTMVISSAPVQQRIDFGVPAKSMAVEFIYNGNGGALALNGFTIEYRWQRNT